LQCNEREARRVEHEAWLAECRERDRQQRLEYKRRRAEAEEAERAEAERQAGIVRARQHEQRRAETAERNRQQARDRTLTGSALRSAKFAKQRRDLSDALDNFMQTKFPAPPPEPQAVYVQPEDDGSADLGSRNFDPAKWAKKPRSWF
jgi:hypothetical protein